MCGGCCTFTCTDSIDELSEISAVDFVSVETSVLVARSFSARITPFFGGYDTGRSAGGLCRSSVIDTLAVDSKSDVVESTPELVSGADSLFELSQPGAMPCFEGLPGGCFNFAKTLASTSEVGGLSLSSVLPLASTSEVGGLLLSSVLPDPTSFVSLDGG